MPTVPLTAIIFNRHDCLICFRDMAGGITRMSSDDMRTIAIALTQAEWSALKLALMQPDQWVNIIAQTDSR